MRIDQATLAEQAGISVVTVRRMEEPLGLSKVSAATFGAVRDVLEQAGAEFIERGVRKSNAAPEDLATLIADVRAIASQARRYAADHPPLTDDDLFDENGLPH